MFDLQEKRINALAVSEHACDEFLKRELGLNILYTRDINLDKNSETNVIVISDKEIGEFESQIRKRPSKSVIILLLNNETLNISIFKKLFAFESVKAVFSHYIGSASIVNGIKGIVSTIFISPKALRSRLFYLALARGFRRFLKQIWLRNYAILSLPLGYTNNFAFSLLQLKPQYKLENQYSFENLKIGPEFKFRDDSCVFTGSLTGPVRKILLQDSKFRKQMRLKVKIVDQWGSADVASDTSYVDEMSNSKWVFTPPGHVSNFSFRFYEALICGSIPVEVFPSPQDWSKRSAFSGKKADKGVTPSSLRKLIKMNAEQLEKYQSKMRAVEIERIKECRAELIRAASRL